jgi:hypothetical protein
MPLVNGIPDFDQTETLVAAAAENYTESFPMADFENRIRDEGRTP